MKCKICHSCDLQLFEEDEYIVTYKRKKRTLQNLPYQKCLECGDSRYPKSSQKKIDLILLDFRREEQGYLISEDINQIKIKMGFDTEDLARILCMPLHQIERIEDGKQFQNRAADLTLRKFLRKK